MRTYLLTVLRPFRRYSASGGTNTLLTSGIAASRRYRHPCNVETLLGRWVLFKPLAIIFTSLSAVVESWGETVATELGHDNSYKMI